MRSGRSSIVKRQIDWMDKGDNRRGRRRRRRRASANRSSRQRSATPKEEGGPEEGNLGFLHNKKRHLFGYTGGSLLHYADSLGALDPPGRAGEVHPHSRATHRRGKPRFPPAPALNSVLPLGQNHLEFTPLPDHGTDSHYGCRSASLRRSWNQEGGGYYGQSKRSGNLVSATGSSWHPQWGSSAASRGSGQIVQRQASEIANSVLAHPGTRSSCSTRPANFTRPSSGRSADPSNAFSPDSLTA